MDAFGTAKVVQSLLACYDKFSDAKSGAQLANDEQLFGRLHRMQMDVHSLLTELVKTKGERNGNDQASQV